MELDNVYSIIVIKNIKGFVIVAYIIINDICKKIIPPCIAICCNINDSIMSDSKIITICMLENHSLSNLKKLG